MERARRVANFVFWVLYRVAMGAMIGVPVVAGFWMALLGTDGQVQRLTAMITPAIALLAASVAYAQWRIAKRKLQLDLFDRQYQMYTVIQRMFSKILLEGKADMASFVEFENAAYGSRWLFEHPMVSANLTNAFRLMRKIDSLTTQLEALDPHHQNDQITELKDALVKRQATLKNFRDTLDQMLHPDLQLSGNSRLPAQDKPA